MRRFRPGWLPTLLVAALLPLLIGLGFWQLQRGHQKEAMLAGFEARRQAPAQPVAELERQSDPAYVRLQLQGFFDPAHSLLLDSRTRNGQVGVELLQPFYDQPSGLWLLVNRGWLPWPDRRTPVQFDTPETPLQLKAWVYLAPGPGFLLKQTPSKGWPQLINQVDAPRLWQQLGRGGLPFEVRLEPGPAAYQADWPVVGMGPERHVGYAVQWFALALALLVLFIYLGLHNGRHADEVDIAPPG